MDQVIDRYDLPLLLNVNQAAELLGMHVGSVRRSLVEDRIPGVKVGGRWYVDRDVIMGKLKAPHMPDVPNDERMPDIPNDEHILPADDDWAERIVRRCSKALKQLRIDHGYNTIKDLTDTSGIAYHSYLGYEKGRFGIPLDMAVRLADFYQCSLDTVVGRDFRYDKEANSVQVFYDNLSNAGKAEMEGFMSYLEFKERYAPSSTPGFMEAKDDSLG